ncbi:MAG: tyrosine-protein kinase domain-containing protein [Anaerolineae bacterium]
MGKNQLVTYYLALMRKWWWLVCLAAFIAGASSFIGTLQMARVYRATTTVMVGQSLDMPNPTNQDLYIAQQLAQTYAALVRRQPVLKAAAEALGLNYVPSADSIATRQIPSTQLLEISVYDTDPVRATALADEVAHQLILLTPAASETEERSDFVRQQLQDLEERIAVTKESIAEEEQALEAATNAQTIETLQSNITALQNKLASYQSTYASLLGTLTLEGATNSISVVEAASVPTSPVSPNVPQTVLLAVAIGMALAVAGVFLIEFLDDRIRSTEELTQLVSLPLMAAVPQIPGKEYADKLVKSGNPGAVAVESYRSLCANLLLSSPERPWFSLMITSSGPSEGKSLTAANLGVALAGMGKRVVIVDWDFRQPAQHRIFGLANKWGLSDALLSPDRSIMGLVQDVGVKGLSVLTSGPIPPNPMRDVASVRLSTVFGALRHHADILIVDGPPPLVIADTAVLASRMDSVLLVADLSHTHRQMAKRAVDELVRMKANLIGVVANRVERHQAHYPYLSYQSLYAMPSVPDAAVADIQPRETMSVDQPSPDEDDLRNGRW